MRIIGGKFKRKRFEPPKGFPSRPTTDFAKEGLFNVLVHQFDFANLEILDLFAGTGNITFEFASREAGSITAIDKDFKCVRFIQSFIKELDLEKEVFAFKADVMNFIENNSKKYDIIFADPPFDEDIHEELINKILERKLLKENGVLVVEHGKRNNFENHGNFEKAKKYGNVIFSFFRENL